MDRAPFDAAARMAASLGLVSIDEVAAIAPSLLTDEAAEHRLRVRAMFPLLDWDELWEQDDDEEEWIIEPLLPVRRLIAMYSAPKVGKSLLMLEIAVAIVNAHDVLGTSIDRRRRVLYIDFENDPRADVRTRLQAMGHKPSDLGGLCYLSFPNLGALDSERGAVELMEALVEYACEVVVIDTVSRAVSGDENENDTWLDFYRHTGLRLKQAGVSLIRLDHSGKDETKGQRGGSAKVGDVDAVWRLSRVSDTILRLDCEAERMPIRERTLTLHRETSPYLHHRVDALGHVAAIEAAKDDLQRRMDLLDVDRSLSRDDVRKVLKAHGQKGLRNTSMDEVIARRLVTVLVVPDARELALPFDPSPSLGDDPGRGEPRE